MLHVNRTGVGRSCFPTSGLLTGRERKREHDITAEIDLSSPLFYMLVLMAFVASISAVPSILNCQVQRQKPGEGQSAICPKSHTLWSNPGLPLASPGCLSPAGRGKEKIDMLGAPTRCQVMHQGHSCTFWLHIFCRGLSLYLFVGLGPCPPFWTYFEHYLPALLPQRGELPAMEGGHPWLSSRFLSLQIPNSI